ncbi:Regulatory protein GntR, HTH [Magnetospirillum sp. LM-5]|uniref:aminotransferase-like domain-containing protein n=1 Tax=Magnetospirillum sp. LM-5 TaxID=2681466 RepID=UPI00137F8216|nr:PLP-dependent aminotransferase family protein [Magnetospirillum sp. LM-5]CAA7612634.1 Regulatory protein GntR, HTH [Magnetospirillum sp. LM-5]
MSNWLPDLAAHGGPKYRAIADAIEADIASGGLAPGFRMPTHRDLAWRLKVTVGTVARAYVEAERRGLLSGEVGRGTFVTDPARQADAALPEYLAVAWRPQPDTVNLAVNRPGGDQGAWAVGPVLERIGRRPDLPQLLSYNLDPVGMRHRQAGALWLKREKVEVVPELVSVTAGSQQAIVAALATLTRAGDMVAAEELTYPGFKSAAALLGRPVVPVAMDEHGLIPDEVDKAFAKGARLLYTTATVQNPTTATLSAERRRAIAQLARAHDAFVLEDGVHRFLDPDGPDALQVFAPERVIYLTTLSKSVSPGLRAAFAAVPAVWKGRFDAAIGALSLALPVPLIEAACILIDEGQAIVAADRQRAEAMVRLDLAAQILGDELRPTGAAFNLWLPLALPWTSLSFVAEAARHGVNLAPTESFAIGRPHQDGVRVSVTAPPDHATLERGLRILAGLLAAGPGHTMPTV